VTNHSGSTGSSAHDSTYGGKGGTMGTTVSADGTTIAFERSGGGRPVVLVGGAFNIRATAAPLAALLASDLTVFTYDRRGRGDSGDTAPYSVAREVEDLAAVVEEAGGSAAVYGLSSGAALALRAAAEGVPVTRLALYEPPFLVVGDDTRAPTSVDLAQRYAELTAEGRRTEAVQLFLTTAGLPPEVVDDMHTQPVWPALEGLAHTLAYDTSILGDGSVPTESAATVTVPTLVIDGGASPGWARRSVAALVEALPDGRLRTLDGQTHDVDPAVLAPVLLEFFAG
jgi:pimeloyl-ACP methyl ester carboxylesterase